MAESMVERVARELAKNAGWDWDALPFSRAEWRPSHRVDYTAMHQTDYLAAARVAIEAMREPTEAMMEAADEPFHDELTKQRAYAMEHYGKPAYATGGFTERMWRAMITAALAEGEEG